MSMYPSRNQRRRHVRSIALILAAGDDVDPDKYHKEHGRCPKGFEFNKKEKSCQPSKHGERKERKQSRTRKGELDKLAAEDPTAYREEIKKSRAANREKLDKLSEEDFGAYEKEVARMRESGELPSKEVSQLLIKIKSEDDIPDEALNDPVKLQQIIDQQEAVREDRSRRLQAASAQIADFEKKREQAKEAGQDPPKMDFMKLMSDLNMDLPTQVEEVMDESASDDLFAAISDSAPEPGSRSSKMKKWFENLFSTPSLDFTKILKRLRGGSTGAGMDIRATLDAVAEVLERRGAKKLAAVVDSELSENFPEADDLAEVTPGKEWDRLFTVKTSDYSEDLGFPPYDRVRPAVKGDEAAASTQKRRRVKAAGPMDVKHISLHQTQQSGWEWFAIPMDKNWKRMRSDMFEDGPSQALLKKRWKYVDDAQDETKSIWRNATVSAE